jgi:hypothetical protein
MKDIKNGTAKDELDYSSKQSPSQQPTTTYESVLSRAITESVYPEGHPVLNDWCLSLNQELGEDIKAPYCYTKSEDPWNNDDDIKVLKL